MEQLSIGDETLNSALNGGVPAEQAMLITGQPGTGKSTLAMQFLQAGIDQGDRCLYISTEQTPAGIRRAFDTFPFDIEAPELALTSLHTEPGQAHDRLEDGLVCRTLDGSGPLDDRSLSFSVSNLVEYFGQAGECDRVVLDSASGLTGLTSDADLYRRAIHDIIQLFTNKLGATLLLTAEQRGESEFTDPHSLLQYTTDGVIQLRRKPVNGSLKRFLRVVKTRGIDHDQRSYLYNISADGISVLPHRRTQPTGLVGEEVVETGFSELDNMLSGGLTTGAALTVVHDNYVDNAAVVLPIIASLLRSGYTACLSVPASLTVKEIDRLWEASPFSVEDAVETNRLFLIDYTGSVEIDHPNVFALGTYDGLSELIDAIVHARDERVDSRFVTALHLDSLAYAFSTEEVAAVRPQFHDEVLNSGDMPIYILNPAAVPDEFTPIFTGHAEIVLNLFQDEDGIEFLQLQKAKHGRVGQVRAVDYIEEPPYVVLR
jgi:circadian clock protein KaiC